MAQRGHEEPDVTPCAEHVRAHSAMVLPEPQGGRPAGEVLRRAGVALRWRRRRGPLSEGIQRAERARKAGVAAVHFALAVGNV
ncbi:hypothetical protein DSM19430T_12920 [Desulfovibrio psychrotolerans]|uniref:Uncharacterized protein n=1 Tax=Desulfovibrio psychrotolerans TaxID=415242 RepID=A0A7J0BSH2_9BACT|nr:hypothetical protein DSM19430T_12920 [Desulfovibrio psychrotolerans]